MDVLTCRILLNPYLTTNVSLPTNLVTFLFLSLGSGTAKEKQGLGSNDVLVQLTYETAEIIVFEVSG
jgi:hypothetical protein